MNRKRKSQKVSPTASAPKSSPSDDTLGDEGLDPKEEVPVGDIEVLPASDPELLSLEDKAIVPEEELSLDIDASSSSRDIVPYDTLHAYLQEVRRYPLLSREEEHSLAVAYREQGDLDAARKLVLGNLRLVIMIAREYQRAVRSLLDLIQEGNIGLMEAVKKFDPYRGIRFPSYAVWWIRAYIVRYVIANWRLVKIGTTQAQRKLFFNLKKEQEKLERLGFFPAPKLLAEKLDVKESDIIEMQQRMGSPDVSMDAPIDGDSETTFSSFLSSDENSAEDTLAHKQWQSLLSSSFDEFQKSLNEKEKAIFERRLLNEEKSTLEDLGAEFKLSRERIRQIESRIKEKLKEFLQAKLGPDFNSEMDL